MICTNPDTCCKDAIYDRVYDQKPLKDTATSNGIRHSGIDAVTHVATRTLWPIQRLTSYAAALAIAIVRTSVTRACDLSFLAYLTICWPGGTTHMLLMSVFEWVTTSLTTINGYIPAAPAAEHQTSNGVL